MVSFQHSSAGLALRREDEAAPWLDGYQERHSRGTALGKPRLSLTLCFVLTINEEHDRGAGVLVAFPASYCSFVL